VTQEPGCGFLKPLAVLLPPNLGVLWNSCMLVCMLGKTIFPLNYCFPKKKMSLGSHLFLIIMRTFAREKCLNITNKILCTSRSGWEESTNHDPNQAIHQNKKDFFQVLCHIKWSLFSLWQNTFCLLFFDFYTLVCR